MMMEKRVTLYTQPGCSECKAAKEFLSVKGIPFEEKNISKDTQAVKEMTKKYNSHSTPTILVDGRVIIGFNQEELERVLS